MTANSESDDLQAWLDTIRCRQHATHWVTGCERCQVCIDKLKAKADRRRALSLTNIKLPCGVCNEQGVVRGFWWGTIKTCPACHGKGYR